jgi:outer membrane protein OmpA-like peptidoglycan-associated protein
MSNRFLVILLFVGWSFLCWRIYVCRIKQACPGQTQTFGATAEAVGAAATAAAASAVEPITNATSDSGTTAATNAATESAFTTGETGIEKTETSSGAGKGGGTAPATNSKASNTAAKAEKMESTASAATTGAAEEHVTIEETADEATIHFPYNSTRKVDNDEMNSYLTKLAGRLKASGEKVLITGHTDGIGDPKTNNDLALQRAQSIRAILIKKGVSAKTITCRSFGERKPVASDDTPAGRYKNRRAVLTVQ